MAKKQEQAPKTPNVESNTQAELSDGELESVTGGASDYLLKIDGIKGESTDLNHKIEISSFSWGVSQTGSLLKQ